jgi:hypothetical protein
VRTVRFIAPLSLLLSLLIGVSSAGATGTTPTGTPTNVSMFGFTSVVTSTGVHLEMSVQISRFGRGADADRSVFIALDRGGLTGQGLESHSWSFDIPTTEISYDPATSSGSADTMQTLEPYADVAVEFAGGDTATSSTCGGATTTDRPASATGTVTLHTNSEALGTVTIASDTSLFGTNASIESDYGQVSEKCFGGAECFRAVDVAGPGGNQGAFESEERLVNGRLRAEIDFDRFTQLSDPAASFFWERLDHRFVPVPRFKMRRTREGGIRIRLGPDIARGITGSATVIGAGEPKIERDRRCGAPGLRRVSWRHVAYVNGPHRLTVHQLAFGSGQNRTTRSGGQISFEGVRVPPVPRRTTR